MYTIVQTAANFHHDPRTLDQLVEWSMWRVRTYGEHTLKDYHVIHGGCSWVIRRDLILNAVVLHPIGDTQIVLYKD